MGTRAPIPSSSPDFNTLQSATVWNRSCEIKGVLRITTIARDKVVLKLEGRLVGPWVDELMKTVLRTNGQSQPLEIDVSDLTFADDNGANALRWLHLSGARFHGKGPCAKYLFERLKIPLFSHQREPDEGDSR